MSLSFFITLSLLSSRAFLSKKLLPSPYEITHLLQKNSLRESDQKLVNFLLKKDQKINDFNPELIYEVINKNSHYQEILQDIKTNYQQVSNKEITKTKSKSSSSKKIFESFAKWQTSLNFNKPFFMYYFAKQYLEKDPKLSQNEINNLVKDLKDNKALYPKIIGNFWDNTKKNEEKKLTSFLKSNQKAWNLIDFLINNNDTQLYSDWKNQLTIDQKKMLFKYSEMLKKESVLDFIKNSPDFSVKKMRELYIMPSYFNQWVRWWWASNKVDYAIKKSKWYKYNHIDNIWKELIKNKDFFQKLFDKFFDKFRKLKLNEELIQTKWKESEKYKQEKTKDDKYDNKPKYQIDLITWINNIKMKPIDGDSSWRSVDSWIFKPFQAFISSEAYIVKESWKPGDYIIPFKDMPDYKIIWELGTRLNWLNYRIELDGLNYFIDFNWVKKDKNRMTFFQDGNYNRDVLRWIVSKKNNPHPSVIKFIFDRSKIIVKEDGVLSVEGIDLHHRYKLDKAQINSIFSKWNQIKDNDINVNLLSSALLKTNLKPTLKSIIDDFVKFASQNQIKNNKQLNQQASKQLLGIITHIAKTLSSDPKLKESYAKWNLSYKNKKWEWDDLESLLNKGKKKNWKDRTVIKQIKNHFQDFFKKTFTLDENLREYFVKHCIKEIILSNKDNLDTKHFLTKWYKKNERVDLNAKYQEYLEKA